jgi:hypothetical protein
MTQRPAVEAYPLQWPDGWPRTKQPQRSRFAHPTVAVATDEVLAEIARFGGSYPVISSNMELRKDGLPRSDRRMPSDTGVAVYFLDVKRRQKCLACDQWDMVGDNLHAIALSIAALRGLERWGAGQILERAMHAFEALPHLHAEAPWYVTLGVDSKATMEQIRQARMALARKYHPNNGTQPDEAMMARINAAAEVGLKERGQ